MLVLLPKLATTRFFVPANMLTKILALADPVVTCSDNLIRLESFSACGSAYARMDINSEACHGEFLGKGTTNVDFQQKLRDALTAFGADGDLRLAVGKEGVKLSIEKQEFVERKVKLPVRWVKGFAEVAAYQVKMSIIHDVSKVSATRFLQTMSVSGNEKADYYVVSRRGELSVTQQKQTNAVKIAGISRLKLLRSLIPAIDRLRIYGDPSGNASSWLIDAGPYSLEFVISAAAYRGFSGEGQLLHGLASAVSEKFLPSVQAALHWQAQIDSQQLADCYDTTQDVINQCLNKLGSAGLVGFDCSSSHYFHRELPFTPEASVSFNPRLRAAKEIIAEDVIEITDLQSDFAEARVSGSGVTHIVRSTTDGSTCTCVWYAKHQNNRGPCKHILSLQMLLESNHEH
jgi:hypothetical protein